MSAEVIQFGDARSDLRASSGTAKAPHKLKDKVPALTGSLVTQTNAENLQYESKLHKQNHALVEKINVFTRPMVAYAEEARARWTEWCSYEQQVTHEPFISRFWQYALTAITVVGEGVLAATAMAGLRLSDIETYIMSGGVVGVGFASTKALAHSLRWLIAERHKTPLLRWAEVAMIVVGISALVGMLWGLSAARVAYSAADAQSGGQAMSDVTSTGLTLLQCALYIGQIFVFWALAGPNMLAERARLNYVKARKQLTKLHTKRAKLAAQLNENVNRFRAKWEENIELARQFMGNYYRELAIHGKAIPDEVSIELRVDWFDQPSSRISPPVDAVPELVQQLVNGLPPSPMGAIASTAPTTTALLAAPGASTTTTLEKSA